MARYNHMESWTDDQLTRSLEVNKLHLQRAQQAVCKAAVEVAAVQKEIDERKWEQSETRRAAERVRNVNTG